jgi:MscS family membrane protein
MTELTLMPPLHDLLPGPLAQKGPAGVFWWQWLALVGLAVMAGVFGAIASAAVRKLLAQATSRTSANWDDQLLARLRGPLILLFAIGLARILVPLLQLPTSAEAWLAAALRGLLLASLLWTSWRVVDVGAQAAWESSWSQSHMASRALIPLLRRAGQAVVAIAAFLLLLSALGYQITSLIAGLGIGGLALALASQKTVENLFGAFSLGIDQPFREGDFVRVEDVVGTVESLGLRSTQIRTLDRTLVSIPNGKLAEMRLETFAVRDRLRLSCTVGLEYGTSAEQMRSVLDGLERVLREHPKIWPDNVIVRFKQLGASSLDIEVMAWFTTSDWSEFLLIRQETLLAFMGVVERCGCHFAFPTQTVHLVPGAPSG